MANPMKGTKAYKAKLDKMKAARDKAYMGTARGKRIAKIVREKCYREQESLAMRSNKHMRNVVAERLLKEKALKDCDKFERALKRSQASVKKGDVALVAKDEENERKTKENTMLKDQNKELQSQLRAERLKWSWLFAKVSEKE